MFEAELKFLQENIDLVENNKFDELYYNCKYPVAWKNVLKICYDPEIDINPLEGLTTVPSGFFAQAELPGVDIIIPASVQSITIRNASMQSLKFENPDTVFDLQYVEADKIILPTNSTLADGSNNRLYEVDAEVVLSKQTDYIGSGAITGSCPQLILIWTAPGPVRMAKEYTPKNKNYNWWHASKTNLHIRR